VEMPSAAVDQEYSDELDEDEAEAEFTVAAE
jgi:hypothetical protein